MSATNEFIVDRTYALANLVLTRRPEVRVTRTNSGYVNLLAEIMRPDPKNDLTSVYCPIFCLLEGTPEDLPNVAHANSFGDASYWKRLDRLRYCSPALFLLFSMVDDRGYFGWYTEPTFENEVPVLRHPAKVKLAEIRRNSLDTIVTSVVTWYDALAESLVRDERTAKATRRLSHA